MFIFLLIIAGLGAGIVTGLAGASAATIVTPVMSMFGGLPPYTAITIALFTDVFASAVSAYTFWKNGNIDLKNGLFLSIFVVTGSIIGSYVGTLVESEALGKISVIAIVLLSISFLRKSIVKKKEDLGLIEVAEPELKFQKIKLPAIIFFGILVGFMCGFVGAGGGLMILVILTAILGLDTKTGVGTSVLVMAFTALSGGIAHFISVDFPASDPLTSPMLLIGAIAISSVAAIIGAKVAASYANKTKEYVLLRIVALTFLILVSASVVRVVLF